MLIINFKTYKESTGEKALILAQIAQNVSERIGIEIIIAPQVTDIFRIKKATGIEIWAQHLDDIDPGRHTGWISPFALCQAGATGVLLNHSEHRLSLEEIEKRVKYAKKYGLKTLVLTDFVDEAKEINLMDPDYIGFEKEELIEGNVSIIEAEGSKIEEILDQIDQPLIIGSGINEEDDVRESLKIGAKGVILASAVIKAQNIEEKLTTLAKAYKQF